jgi:hypothetical protein
MIKVDGQFIVSAACNNGTTALVNRDGELLMFGKDTAHVDSSTGELPLHVLVWQHIFHKVAQESALGVLLFTTTYCITNN